MQFEQARFNMIEQQIRPWDVLNQNVLDMLDEIPRDRFTPEAYRSLAYADVFVPLDHDQVMMKPVLVGRMMQALDLHPTDSVLEVGTGTGYVTAMMARLTHRVCSVDIFPELTGQARTNLDASGIENVTLETGDAARGWREAERFDVIAITGSTPVLPETFRQSLNRGGRLFAVVGKGPVMEAVLIRRSGESEWTSEVLFETELPELVNALQTTNFEF